jgi:GTP-binding protein
VIDMAGYEDEDAHTLPGRMRAQTMAAVREADAVLFLIDARAGVTPLDEEISRWLREEPTPVILAGNKAEGRAAESGLLEAYALGLGDPISVSALHGRGTGDLLDAIVEALERIDGAEHDEDTGDEIRVAILGRPNVGKSSLLNAILGRPRVIVSEVAGTTRDSVDTVFVRNERHYRLIDTAGLRRKRKHRQGIEYYSELRALQAVGRADIALVLVDSSDGLVEGDLAVADEGRKAGCATLVVLSKWDITTVEIEDVRQRMLVKLRQRPAIMTTSALTGRNVDKLLDAVEELFGRFTSRAGTGVLNRAMEEITAKREPPRSGRRRLNLLYATQYDTRPPRFRIVVNDRSLVTRDYAYYVENQLRARLGLEGAPVIIDFQSRT